MGIRIGTTGLTSPCIYLIDSPEHPAPLDKVAEGLICTVVSVPVPEWGAKLTPWPATALYRGEADYAGEAQETLAWLHEEALPQAERDSSLEPTARAIAGYSLAGLFSLYAFLRDTSWTAVACLSGSLWYEDWLPHVESLDFPTAGRYAFLSLGSKERRASRPQLKQVQERTEACVELMRERGLETDFVLNPGGHLTDIDWRIQQGLQALDAHLR